ncbi:MAG: LodA/GoxA family CTQ-dependent oxidase, partial [Solirubrobacteraceae bacterium]
MAQIDDISFCKIHPAIGIARVGDSPTEYFIGPETPGEPSAPAGGFKDPRGKVKRQAARFRVFGYGADGRVVRELTAADAVIIWTVQLVNRKSAAAQFDSVAADEQARLDGTPLPLRNAAIQNSPGQPEARLSLVVDPGPRSITGVGALGAGYALDGGAFLGIPVPLGELRTDQEGRLLVLGGAGSAGAFRPDVYLSGAMNNDGWFDDTSDGPVSAHVVLNDGAELPVEGAWVIVGPPDYSPATANLVTLYDVLRDLAVGQGWLPTPERVSFTRDIYPLFDRVNSCQWVSARALRGHGAGRTGDLLPPDLLAKLADCSADAGDARQAVFRTIRDPNAAAPREASGSFMPALSGDGGTARHGDPSTWLTVTPTQYAMLRRWACGDFDADWTGSAPPSVPLDALSVEAQPEALDRAALEACVGGAFAPGYEASWVVRDPAIYAEPFRLAHTVEPGTLTDRLTVPWQAGVFERSPDWWPAQRPDDVAPEDAYERALVEFPVEVQERKLGRLLLDRVPWTRGLGTVRGYRGPAELRGHHDMVTRWNQLGFVQRRTTPDGEVVYVEAERPPYALLTDRDYYHILLNLESHPGAIPAIGELAEAFLANTRRHMGDPNLADTQCWFPYSREAFAARLDETYDLLAEQARAPGSPSDGLLRNRDDVVERILQIAPYSQIDGTWLHNITPNGPLSEIQGILFQIWIEEMGAGDLSANHANLYTGLLRDLGIFLPEPHSRAYADDPRFFDSAFTLPVMLMCVAQFPRRYFPELLGLTLCLEWEVLEVKTFIDLARGYGIPTQFYEIHVGVDNAVSGHGAKARRAIELYLDQVRVAGGEEAAEEAWRRVWTGYNLFGATSTLGRDLARKFSERPVPREQMLAMIERKRRYAAFNHRGAMLGNSRIDDWFDDPEGLLDALAASPLVVAGRPEESPMLTRFKSSGPMFGVFTPDELLLWQDWIRSLALPTEPGHGHAAGGRHTDRARAMAALIDCLRPWRGHG